MNAHELLVKHSQEWSLKYPGKYVALVGDKFVAVSGSGLEAFKKAKQMFPKEKISTFYIPTEEETMPLLGYTITESYEVIP